MTDLLSAEILHAGLRTRLLAQAILYLPECASTNQAAREAAEKGAADGTLVITDYQTAGRGRLGRTWVASRGSSLLFSLILRPPIPVKGLAQISMAAGLGVAEAIRSDTGLEARIKWPNDILVGGRKLGGMLSDASLADNTIAYVIIGIGVNGNFNPAACDGIPPEATSLSVCAGCDIPRASLMRAILGAIEPRYRSVCAGANLREEWARALDTLGREVRVTMPDGDFSGVADAVDDEGALLVRMPNGTQKRITAGDVITTRSL
jgi:BirA family transcriptional regulator, biotin operon repressor / biotin---[acetyl-CoA-carboxylase] ligase